MLHYITVTKWTLALATLCVYITETIEGQNFVSFLNWDNSKRQMKVKIFVLFSLNI